MLQNAVLLEKLNILLKHAVMFVRSNVVLAVQQSWWLDEGMHN